MNEPLVQKIFVRMDPRLVDLSTKDKVKLIDSIGGSAGAKALIVDLDFSHTGRRINRRVYSKAGHMNVPNDLTRPYPKPITLDHEDGVKNIIGRIVAADYVDMMSEARSYFRKRRLSEAGLNQIHDSLASLDFEKAADAFHRTKILQDKNWKGIGRVAAKARITDGDAIVKFFDQRYLTFSAEQDSDAYVCSICLSDWYKDGMCDHSPGAVIDGKLAFMMTGNMVGMGSSVVTHPADPDSLVTGLSLSDSDEDPIEVYNRMIDTFIVDSKGTLVDQINEVINMKDLLIKLLDGATLSAEEIEALYEQAFSSDIIKDKSIVEDGKEIKLTDVKLSAEDIIALPDSSFIGYKRAFPVPNAAHAQILKILLDDLNEQELCVDFTEDEIKELENLDIEFETEMGDAKLSTEARKKLKSSSFCGPNRSFPVPDCAHVTAARRLIGRAGVSESTKTKIMGCVNRKAKSMGCDSDDAITSTINNKLKAFDCSRTQEEVEKEIQDVRLSLQKIIDEAFSTNFIAKLSDEDFTQKIWAIIKDRAESLKLYNPETVDKVQLEQLQKQLEETKTKAEISERENIRNRERADALKIEFRELLQDHIELAKKLQDKNKDFDQLLDKVVPVASILKPDVDLSDKTVKNICALLDSLDTKSLESKLSDGLTSREVKPVEDPTLANNNSDSNGRVDLPAYEKEVLERYKNLRDQIGEKAANTYFNKVKQYCKKDFNPASLMEN